MKKLIITSFVLLMLMSGMSKQQRIGNLLLSGIPEIPVSIADRLHPYQHIRSARFVDWLPEGSGILIKTRFSETSQIHAVETPGGQRRQLTFFNEPIDECTVCPDFSKPVLLFTKDSAGNERNQIYRYDYRSGTYTLLTDGKSKYNSVVWSRKGDKYAFRSNRRDRRDYDVYLGNPGSTPSFKAILKQGGYWYPVEFSPDDKKLLVKKYISSGESYYYILDLRSKQIRALDDDTTAKAYGTARWAPDMMGIYVVSDKFSIFKQLLYFDLQKRDFRVLSEQIPWDIMEVEIAPSGDMLALTSNEDGYTRLYLMDTKTGQLNRVNLPDGQIYGLSFKPGGSELAITLNTPQQPSDVYVLNLESRTSIRWTHSELGGLDASAFTVPRMIHYPTFDSFMGQPRTIPAYYYEPVKHKPPYPVLIDCHGGPAVQEKPYFSYLFQFYLNELGIAVIAPNIRGSTGYGREFMLLDDGEKREDAVKDIGALLDWIESQPRLDARRIAVKGGSYGGYMALASMVHYSSRLCCGIDEWGISHFVTFLENTGKYRQDVRRAEYGDERDPAMRELLDAISPLTNAHEIKKPMFIVQGLHDPRVPASEAEQITAAIRENDVDVWYLLAEDEGHGFGKKSNRNVYQQILILFLERYLLGMN
ncbi:MAG: prolyl oligopeptidase family serine peptidase [candidate division WOR-3 bacterium]|jgi:dipeptidyl aminopeptidase/acylaminoacyl peptidase